MRFEYDIVFSIESLRQALLSHTYRVGKYNRFKVYEPKEREIMALSYADRVVQHSLCDNVLEPYLDARLDYDNAACRKGKGTHFALFRLEKFLRQAYNRWGTDFYVLKCDIRKYFYNIDHRILKENLYRYIEDREIIWLLDVIIDSTPDEVGIPIGNMTSQWFAVFYLDVMDRYIREELKIPFYTRYMDDFVLIDRDKERLSECLRLLRRFLGERLRLELNSKTQIFPAKNGIDYLGFHSYITDTGKVIRKLRKSSKEKMKKKIRYFNSAYERGEITLEAIEQSVAAWIGHAKHGNTYNLRRKTLGRLKLKGCGKQEEEVFFYNDYRDYDVD